MASGHRIHQHRGIISGAYTARQREVPGGPGIAPGGASRLAFTAGPAPGKLHRQAEALPAPLPTGALLRNRELKAGFYLNVPE